MAWHDDDRETDPEQSEDFRDARPYHERREDYVDHIADAHDVDRDVADRALEKIENHTLGVMADVRHFGFGGVRHVESSGEGWNYRSKKTWARAHVGDVPLGGKVNASQTWVRPMGVAHNLFHSGTQTPISEEHEGDPDYDPSWDEESHRQDREEREFYSPGEYADDPETDLPRFLRHTDGSYTCLDGHHRVAADLLLGKPSTRGYVIHEKQLAGARS